MTHHLRDSLFCLPEFLRGGFDVLCFGPKFSGAVFQLRSRVIEFLAKFLDVNSFLEDGTFAPMLAPLVGVEIVFRIRTRTAAFTEIHEVLVATP
jgi:hypothetical protein